MERRRESRHSIERCASYRLGTSAEWRACRVVEMGTTGIVVELIGLRDDRPLCSDIAVKFELPEDVVVHFELLGRICRRGWISEGRFGVWIEFRGFRLSEPRPSRSLAAA